jgi:hypothetical protein
MPVLSAIETGEQTIVYRESLPGVYEGTLVSLGPRMTGPDSVTFYPVLSGLKPGDRVVTSGSFLVDAETRLNPAAGSIYFGGREAGTGGGVTTVRPSTPEDAIENCCRDGKAAGSRPCLAEPRLVPVLDESPLGAMGVPVCHHRWSAVRVLPKRVKAAAEGKTLRGRGSGPVRKADRACAADQPTAPTANSELRDQGCLAKLTG